MKGVGLLVVNFELNPSRRPIWAWPKLFFFTLTCEQALLGVGVGVGRGKRRELATMSQEFSFLRRKSRCKMLIGGH